MTSPSSDTRSLIAALKTQAEGELGTDILPFWLTHSPNPKNGGFYGEVGRDLEPHAGAMRGSLLTARILWTYSAAYRLGKDPAHLAMAQRAAADLRDHFLDPVNGGVFWSIKANGKPLEKTKHTYAEAFALYSLSEYHRATGEKWAAEQALQLYRLLEKHARDPKFGGYFEACSETWELLPATSHNLIGAPSEKSQNTNLHVMEAFTCLHRIAPTPEVTESLRALLVVMMDRVVDAKTHHLTLFQHADWSPVDDAVSYGHDIEFSWLLTEAADELGEPALLARARSLALDVARVTLAEGVDTDGSIFNEGTPAKVTNRMKEWWPQAEAVVGFLNAYQLSGDETYLKAAQKTWSFIEANQIDHEKGEWYRIATTDRRRRDKEPKISFWKCPYHNGRACMEIAARAGELLRAEPAK